MQESDTDNKLAQAPEEPPVDDGSPKFGRLLLLLAFGVAIVVALTFGSQAYYTP
jgi:hypothetical protein